MKRIVMTAAALVFLGVAAFTYAPIISGQAASGQAGAGWTSLFDGKTLDQFTPIGDGKWRIADGVIEASGGMGGFLVTKRPFGDFEFRTEFWVTPDANSGVFIRASNPKQVTATNAYEVNIFDTRPDQSFRTGGIVDVARPLAFINTGNQWNRFEITARGSRLMVRLNDMLMVDTEDTKFARGPIALQAGAGTVRFRNVQVRELTPAKR